MWYAFLYKVLCMAYANVLRELVKAAIDNPDSEIDEVAMTILDKLFNYEG